MSFMVTFLISNDNIFEICIIYIPSQGPLKIEEKTVWSKKFAISVVYPFVFSFIEMGLKIKCFELLLFVRFKHRTTENVDKFIKSGIPISHDKTVTL